MVVSDTRAPEMADIWRLSMEHSPVGMAIVSLTGDFVCTNVALCDLLGYEPEVMTTLTFHDITHPADLASDMQLVRQTLAGEIGSYRTTKRYICADGSIVTGDLSVALLRDVAGVPVHFIAQIVDLTERQAFVDRLDAAEAAAAAERSTAHAIFDGVSVGLLQIDGTGHYLAYNSRLREFLELAFPEGHLGLAGQSGFVYGPDQRLLEPDQMPSMRAARGEEFDDVRLWVGADPATRRALSVSARTVLDRNGLPGGAILAYHDVTAVVRALQVKDEFVSTLSHELRTPLTSALAYLELLDDSTDVGPDGRQQVTAARRNMLRLSHLVADLLFATRASSGSPVVDPYQVDLVTVLAEAVAAATLDAEAGGVRLAPDLPDVLTTVADGMRIRQVVDNLLANAIAYSHPGGTVRITLTADDAHVVLTVADEGVGIEDHEIDQVFDRFFRGENARRRHVSGTGLGLTIVRTIVEAHRGEVVLASAPDAGTTVRILLPR